MDTDTQVGRSSLPADCAITNPALRGIGIRLSLYCLSIAVAVVRHRLPNKRSFNLMNVSLAVAGLILLGSGLWQAFHHTLRLSDAVGLTLLLAVVRPSWRGAWGRKFWLSSLRFPKTPESSSTRVRSGFFDAGIFCGMAPWLNYILVDTVFGHPDTFGPDPTCNHRVRLSLLGAHIRVAVPATPYAVSILLLAVMLAMHAIEAREFGLAAESPLANVVEELNVRQELLDKVDPDSPPWNDTRTRNRVLGSYNKSLQNGYIDVTLYRCIASVLGRVSLVATLEHTLVLNKSEGGEESHHGLQLLQLVVVLSAASILFRGLAYSRLREEEDENAESEDDDDDDHVDLVLWLFLIPPQLGTWRATLADSMSFDTQIISMYFNMRGASLANDIPSNFGDRVRKLLESRETLCRETQRLAREARDVVSLEDELALWVFSIVTDVLVSLLAALMAALVLIVSRSSPLPAHELMRLGALAGTIKAGLANTTSLLCKASSSNFASIVLFFTYSVVVTLAVVAVLAQQILGNVPVSLVNASLIAFLPLMLSQSIMLPTFFLFGRRAFLLLFFDSIGGYTLIKVAQCFGFIGSISPWQGVLMVFVFGVITCVLKGFTLRKVAALEQKETMRGYNRLEYRQHENAMYSHIRFNYPWPSAITSR